MMDTSTTLAARVQRRIARGLVNGHMPQAIVAGTLALAGLGAVALNPTPSRHISPSNSVVVPAQALVYAGPNCFLDPDGDGSTICYIDPGQIASYPGGWCHPDPDGDGHLVCHFRH